MSEHGEWEASLPPFLVTAYSFNPEARTVTFTAFTVIDLNRVMAIYDTTIQPDPNAAFEYGTVLFLAGTPGASTSGNVLTLPVGSVPPGAHATDTLRIHYSVNPPAGYTLLRVANYAALPATGEGQILYQAQDTGQLWEWNGSAYVAV
jgi:hypothetical protein